MTRRRTATRRWAVPLGLMLLLGGLVMSASAVHAANTLHVTSCLDDGGAATLRGVIGTAGDGDTIVFDQDCTIILTQGTLFLDDTSNGGHFNNLTIDGTGHAVTVDGGCTANCGTSNPSGGETVISILGVTTHLTALTIRNGSDFNQLVEGGGIENRCCYSTLTLTNVLVTSNWAPQYGGGIYNGATMMVINSTIASNTAYGATNHLPAGDGGGIYNDGVATVINSTINKNSSLNFGGGISSRTPVSPAIPGAGTTTVINSTITGNDGGLGGGGLADGGEGNTSGTIAITNTIVAGNYAPYGPNIDGSIASGGQNLIGNTGGGSGYAASDLLNASALLGPLGTYGGITPLYPLLPGSSAIGAGGTGANIPTTDQRGVARTGHTDIGAFQSQGFILTKTGGDNASQQTHAPFPPLTLTIAAVAAGAPYNEPVQGGALIVAAPPAADASAAAVGNFASLPANGQVALTPTANGTVGGPYLLTVSAGGPYSVTYSLTNLFAPPNSTYTVGATIDHAGGLTRATTCRATNTTCTLRDALAYASTGTDTVVFQGGVGPAIILTSANGSLVVGANMTITGPGANLLAIDGGCTGCDPGQTPSGGVGVFVVNSGVTASISGLTIRHGIGGAGGGIANGGTLTLTNSTLSGNVATGQGINDGGGGIDNAGGGALTVTNCSFSGNSSTGGTSGGGIANHGSGTLTVTDSAFSGNRSSDNGGGIDNHNGGTLTVANSAFSGNTATTANGGGINNDSSTLTVTSSTFSGNITTMGSGGGIESGGPLTVTSSTFSGNTGGGGIESGGPLTVTSSTFSGNSTRYSGGGINIKGTATVTDSTFTGNTGTSLVSTGGGINNDGTLTVTNCTISGNSTRYYGGGIADYLGGPLTVTGSTISGNSAFKGGGIYKEGGGATVTITNSTLANNSAVAASAFAAGGIENYSGTLTVTNSTVTGNRGPNGGGIENYSGTLTLTNTIVEGNSRTGGGQPAMDITGPITTGGHNLFGTTNGATITLAPSDLVNPNPLLGPLGNNGGPTQTVPLLQGSPAIDAGDDTVCAGVAVGNKDQRGATRPFGAHCDIGAFEYQVVNPLPGAKPTVPAAGNPLPLPPSRPAGLPQGSPNPLPPARP